jgi:hypothetical protein
MVVGAPVDPNPRDAAVDGRDGVDLIASMPIVQHECVALNGIATLGRVRAGNPPLMKPTLV